MPTNPYSKDKIDAFIKWRNQINNRPQSAPQYNETISEGEHYVEPNQSWSSIAQFHYGSQDPFLIRQLQSANPQWTGRALQAGDRLKLISRPQYLPDVAVDNIDGYLTELDKQLELISKADADRALWDKLSQVKNVEPEFGQPLYAGIDKDSYSFFTSDASGSPLLYDPETKTQGYVGIPEDWGLPIVESGTQVYAGIDPAMTADPQKYLEKFYKANPEVRVAHSMAGQPDPLEFLLSQERASYDASLKAATQQQIDITLAGEQRLRAAEVESGIAFNPDTRAAESYAAVFGATSDTFLTGKPLGQRDEDGRRELLLTKNGVPFTHFTEPDVGFWNAVARKAGQPISDGIQEVLGWATQKTGGSALLDLAVVVGSLFLNQFGSGFTMLSQEGAARKKLKEETENTFWKDGIPAGIQKWWERSMGDITELKRRIDEKGLFAGLLMPSETDPVQIAVRTDNGKLLTEPEAASLKALGVDVTKTTPFGAFLLDSIHSFNNAYQVLSDGMSYQFSFSYLYDKGLLDQEIVDALLELDPNYFVSIRPVAEDVSISAGGMGSVFGPGASLPKEREFYLDRATKLFDAAVKLSTDAGKDADAAAALIKSGGASSLEDAQNQVMAARLDKAEGIAMAAFDDYIRGGGAGLFPAFQYTFIMSPNEELEFRHNIAKFILQTGEFPNNNEVRNIRNLNMDMATELIPQLYDLSGGIATIGKVFILGIFRRIAPVAIDTVVPFLRSNVVLNPRLGRLGDNVVGWMDSLPHWLKADATGSAANALDARVSALGQQLSQAYDFAVPLKVTNSAGDVVKLVNENETLTYVWRTAGDAITAGKPVSFLESKLPTALKPFAKEFYELAKIYDPHNLARSMEDLKFWAMDVKRIEDLNRPSQRLARHLLSRGLDGDTLLTTLDDIDAVIRGEERLLQNGSRVLAAVAGDYTQLPNNLRKAAQTFGREFARAGTGTLEEINPATWKNIPNLVREKVYNSAYVYEFGLEMGKPQLKGITEALAKADPASSLYRALVDEKVIVEAEAAARAAEKAMAASNVPGTIGSRTGDLFASAFRGKHQGLLNPAKYDDALIETLAKMVGKYNQLERISGPVMDFLTAITKGVSGGGLDIAEFSVDDLIRRLGLTSDAFTRGQLARLLDDPTMVRNFTAWDLAQELGISTAPGTSRKVWNFAEKQLNNLKALWVYSILHFRPAWTARNIMDSSHRAILASDGIMDDLPSVINRLQRADALPQELIDAFSRQSFSLGGKEELAIVQRMLTDPSHDFSIFSLIKATGEEIGAQWRGNEATTFFNKAVMALQTPFKGVFAGVSSVNTLVEFSLRAMVFDRHFWTTIDAISPKVIDALLDRMTARYNITPKTADALLTLWKTSETNASKLEDLIRAAAGGDISAIRKTYAINLPANLDEIAKNAGMNRTSARLVLQDLDQLITGVLRGAGDSPSPERVASAIDEAFDLYKSDLDAAVVNRAKFDAEGALNLRTEVSLYQGPHTVPEGQMDALVSRARGIDIDDAAFEGLDADILAKIKPSEFRTVINDDAALRVAIQEAYEDGVKAKQFVDNLAASRLGSVEAGFSPADLVDDNGHSLRSPVSHDHAIVDLREARSSADNLLKEIDLDVPEGFVRTYRSQGSGASTRDWALDRSAAMNFHGPGRTMTTRVVTQGEWDEAVERAIAGGGSPTGLEGWFDNVDPATVLPDVSQQADYLKQAIETTNGLEQGLRSFFSNVFPGPLMDYPGKTQRWDTFFELSESVVKETNRMLDEAVALAKSGGPVPDLFIPGGTAADILERMGIQIDITPSGRLVGLQAINPKDATVLGHTLGPQHFETFDKLTEALFGPGIPNSERARLFLGTEFGSTGMNIALDEIGAQLLPRVDAANYLKYRYTVSPNFSKEAARTLAQELPDGVLLDLSITGSPAEKYAIKRGGEFAVFDANNNLLRTVDAFDEDASQLILNGTINPGLTEASLVNLGEIDDVLFKAQVSSPWYSNEFFIQDNFPASSLENRATFIAHLTSEIERFERLKVNVDTIDTYRFMLQQISGGGDYVSRVLAPTMGLAEFPFVSATNLDYLPTRIPDQTKSWMLQQIHLLSQAGSIDDFLTKIRPLVQDFNAAGTLQVAFDKADIPVVMDLLDDILQAKSAVRNVGIWGLDDALDTFKFSDKLNYLEEPVRDGNSLRKAWGILGDVPARISGVPSADAYYGGLGEMFRRITWDALGMTHDGHAVYPGALSLTQNAMLEYGRYSRFDNTMKLIAPFWQFTSRSAGRNIELLMTHPRLFKFEIWTRDRMRTQAIREGLVDSQGRPANRGRMKLPGLDFWVDPTQPFSAFMFLPNRLPTEQDLEKETFGETLGSFLYEVAGPIGFRIAPHWEWALRIMFPELDKIIPKSSLVSQFDLVSPWDQIAIQNKTIPPSLAEAYNIALTYGQRRGKDNIPATWGGDALWKSDLIEKEIYLLTLAKLEAGENPDKVAAAMLAALGYSQQTNEDGVPISYTLQPSEDHPLYLQALRNVDERRFTANRAGFWTGIYGSRISQEELDDRQRQADLNRLRDTINNTIGAHILMLDLDVENRYNTYNEERYSTPEGKALGLYKDFGWVETPEGELLRSTDPRYYEQVGNEIFAQELQDAFWDSLGAAKRDLEAGIKAYGPIGSNQDQKDRLLEEYFDTTAAIWSNPLFALVDKPGSTIFVGNKYPELLLDTVVSGWYQTVSGIKPQWRQDEGMSFTEWELLNDEFEKVNFPVAKKLAADWIETNLIAGISPANIASNAEELGLPRGSSIHAVLKASGGKITLFDGRVLDIPDLVRRAVAQLSFEGFEEWQKKNDTPLQALDEAWKALSGRNDLFSMLDELDARGANQQEKKAAQELFMKKFGSGPSPDELVEWIIQNYPEGQFDKKQLLDLMDSLGVATLTERQSEQTPEKKQTSDIFDLLGNIPPGFRRGDFTDAFTAIGGDTDLLDRWFDPTYQAGVAAALQKGDDEKFVKFQQDLEATFAKLGWAPPTTAIRQQWGQALRDNKNFNERRDDILSEAYGEGWQARFDTFMGASTSERRDIKRKDPAVSGLVDDYFKLACLYAEENKTWASFYMDQEALDRCANPYGGGGGGGFRKSSFGGGGGGGRSGGFPSDFVPAGYRALGIGSTSIFDTSKLGTGGVGGTPRWLPGFGQGTPSGVLRDVAARTNDGVPLPKHTKDYITETWNSKLEKMKSVGLGMYGSSQQYKDFAERWKKALLADTGAVPSVSHLYGGGSNKPQ